MVTHYWKQLKTILSGISEMVKFIASCFGIVVGCSTLHLDINLPNGLLESIILFLLGAIIGFVISLAFFYLMYRFLLYLGIWPETMNLFRMNEKKF